MRGSTAVLGSVAALLLTLLPATPGGASTAPAAPAATAPQGSAPQESAPQESAEALLAEAVELLGSPRLRRTTARLADDTDSNVDGGVDGGVDSGVDGGVDRGDDGGATATHDHPGDATLVLRDLRRALPQLSRADRRTARGLMARPTSGRAVGTTSYAAASTYASTCPDAPKTEPVCFHWSSTPGDPDAPDLTDSDHDGVPDYVQGEVAGTFDAVWQTVVEDLGYTAPQADTYGKEPGPDHRLDVYLADVGPQMYGYCTSDDTRTRARRISAFCVLDNDFAASQFPGDPLDNLRVTAAHEFFHAVQFAYDAYEDIWFMEGTAAWVEEEVFNDVNDNRQYLAYSQLEDPTLPLDYPGGHRAYPSASYRYGSWIFWRYLTEQLGRPVIVRETWDRAVPARTHSVQALKSALSSRRRSFGRTFAAFGRDTRTPKRSFEEGRTYPRASATVLRPVTRRRHRGWHAFGLDHLAHSHAEFRPHRSLGRRARLRIQLDLPARVRGSQASVVVRLRSGRLRAYPVRLNRRGDDRLVVPFNAGRVRAVTLTLTNASTRMRDCGSGSFWWCGGRSRDDGLTHAFRATPFRP